MKNILMIAYAFPPLNFSGTARPFGFAKYLPDFGYRPTILTRLGTGPHPADEKMLGDLENKCDILRIPPGDNDNWPNWLKQKFKFPDKLLQTLNLGPNRFSESLAWRATNFLPGIKEYIHWGRPTLSAAKKIIRQQHFDLIWATGDPWASLITGYKLSKSFNLPWVADIRDPWTYGVMWNPQTPRIAKWNQTWEQKILAHAHYSVFTSPLTRDIYRARVNNPIASRIVSITNGFDNSENNPIPIPKHNDHQCRFCFVGNLTTNRNPQVLLHAFQLARQSIPPDQLTLHFIGRISPYEKLFDSNLVQHTPPVSQDQSRQFMRSADVLVLLQATITQGADVISGKIYEYLAAQKPILAVVPETGGDAWLIRQTNAGLVTGTTDPNKIAHAIKHYWQFWKQNKLVSPVTPDQLDRFSRRNLTRQLAELFDQVLTEQGASCESR
jgi:glycosyltransferase involved in cell wall biosynthesis